MLLVKVKKHIDYSHYTKNKYIERYTNKKWNNNKTVEKIINFEQNKTKKLNYILLQNKARVRSYYIIYRYILILLYIYYEYIYKLCY